MPEPTRLPSGVETTDVLITDLSRAQRRQLVEDLAALRAAGAADNTAAVCAAVRDAASRLPETTRRAA